MEKVKEQLRCAFCQSTRLKLAYSNKFHKFKKDHGPIDFYKCLDCKSGLTYPLPTAEDLTSLYSSFDGGMIPETRRIRDNNPLDKWHNQCVDRAVRNHSRQFTKDAAFFWIDIGAGGGEIAKIIAERYPNSKGYAIDYHAMPSILKDMDNLTWIQCDLNDPEFHKQIPVRKFELALSITVLEHVLNPRFFVENILKLLDKKGALYITVPDMGSIAAKAMGAYWPYLIFGEHLHIPSKTGMRQLLEHFNTQKDIRQQKTVKVQPVVLPYPITYYLDHFSLKGLSAAFSREATIALNTGILEAIVF